MQLLLLIRYVQTKLTFFISGNRKKERNGIKIIVLDLKSRLDAL